MPDFIIENTCISEGYRIIAGVDEAGRGSWAGPVVAAAVILNRLKLKTELAKNLDDSKKLSVAQRNRCFVAIKECAMISVGISNVSEIDSLNILKASMLAMERAIIGLNLAPQIALIDGTQRPNSSCITRCVVRGDTKSLSIAAASIVAKINRDKIMKVLATDYPGFGWDKNAGYGTIQHKLGLDRLGVTPYHRRSFKPIRKVLGQKTQI